MHPKSNPEPESTDDLVLEVLPSQETAWLKPDRRYVLSSRYWITPKGRAAIHADDEASS